MEFEDFTNMNGLVAGKIPKGVQCPFRNMCDAFIAVDWPKKLRCKRHTPDAMENNFYCATAGMFSIIENENRKVRK